MGWPTYIKIIIAGFMLVAAIITVILNGISVSLAREETKTAKEAAELARKAVCQAVEVGMDVNEVSEIAVLRAFVSSLTLEKRAEFKTKLSQKSAFLSRLHSDYGCPSRIGE